ncbi:hypothetical protein CLOM_g10149 [Closterium sp. NIES-68]|nr:hypothetical protein CLOM_g10149 [Closterium sp. NIES-68]GJP71677.1 hypothetical protein CLOP_g2488 [Closterium sp. NIES-67]
MEAAVAADLAFSAREAALGSSLGSAAARAGRDLDNRGKCQLLGKPGRLANGRSVKRWSSGKAESRSWEADAVIGGDSRGFGRQNGSIVGRSRRRAAEMRIGGPLDDQTRRSQSDRRLVCRSANGSPADASDPRAVDRAMLQRAVQLATSSAGLTAPHPFAGCVLRRDGRVVAETWLHAQGTASAEKQAVEAAGEAARGATAYLNLEPGDCHGDDSAVYALIQAGVSRVVVGLLNPLPHHHGRAVAMLRQAGVAVDVLGEGELAHPDMHDVARSCRLVNEALLFRADTGLPFSILKYAMTLDGKIAASTGHAAWVTSREARQRVFDVRSLSDAIIVGGNTVRRDNPRLTTRREGGHIPVRIVMSRSLRLPEDANLWDVAIAPTVVMTQRGAKGDFCARLRERGCEVVEFDFLSPRAVMEYCHQRGFMQVLWECGGTLSAPCIAGGAIHKVMAFVAPKIIGGVTAPSPVGDLGFVEMTQALELADISTEIIGRDLLMTGYLHPLPTEPPILPQTPTFESRLTPPTNPGPPPVISFYKSWDAFGALSNFSPHPIVLPLILPLSPPTSSSSASSPSLSPSSAQASSAVSNGGDSEGEEGGEWLWQTVEQFYQAQKFSISTDPAAVEAVASIRAAETPELAARIGRALERSRPDLLRPNWQEEKLAVMRTALRKKFTMYPHLRELLVSTGNSPLVESSTHDFFWGSGWTRRGKNNLGKLLMRLRTELLTEDRVGAD